MDLEWLFSSSLCDLSFLVLILQLFINPVPSGFRLHLSSYYCLVKISNNFFVATFDEQFFVLILLNFSAGLPTTTLDYLSLPQIVLHYYHCYQSNTCQIILQSLCKIAPKLLYHIPNSHFSRNNGFQPFQTSFPLVLVS